MRFAFRNTGDRSGHRAADETHGEQDTRDAFEDYWAPAEDMNASPDAAEVLALYEEYLTELDKVPTLRDPVLPETSGPHLNLDEKIREIVRDELAKLSGETPRRSSGRTRKRRKR